MSEALVFASCLNEHADILNCAQITPMRESHISDDDELHTLVSEAHQPLSERDVHRLEERCFAATEPHGTLTQLFETFQDRQAGEAATNLAAHGFLKVTKPVEE